MRRCWLAVLGAVLALATLLAPGSARAEEYVIGAEDVLQVSVWMHPELERAVTVSTDGTITFPPVGDLKAAGQTPNQLATRLSDRLSSYLRQTATVTVTVTQYVSRSVFVSGGVTHPGRYGFERLPGVVDVINQAGGAIAGADLTRVQLLRREGDQRRPQTLDVARALREGSDANLPALKPGDTVVVPVVDVTRGAAPGTTAVGEGVSVLGEVTRPGQYPVGDGQDVWTVLAAAGGLTARGNLADVRVMRPKEGGTAVFPVDLGSQLNGKAKEPFVVHSGDVVYVPAKGGWLTGGFGLPQLIGLSVALVNIVIVLDYVQHNH